MNATKLIIEIEKQFKQNNELFFGYAWREKIDNMLTEESRFIKLVNWVDSQITFYQNNINVFNPADKSQDYTTGYFKTYQDSCMNLTMLINLKSILLNNQTTTQMRENIEQTICKVYKIKYSNFLSNYVSSTD